MTEEGKQNGSVGIDIDGPPQAPSPSCEEFAPLREELQPSRSVLPLLPGMRLTAHLIDADGQLHQCDPDEALKKCSEGASTESQCWIDVDADDQDLDEVREWLAGLQLSPFITARLAEPAQTWASTVISLKRVSLVIVRILPEDPTSNEVRHLAALKTKNMLFTFTNCPKVKKRGMGISSAAIKSLQGRDRIPDASSSGALLVWLLFHAERVAIFARELRSKLLQMDEKIDAGTDVSMDDILDEKNHVAKVLAVAEEQTECFETLKEADGDTEGMDFSRLRGTMGLLMASSSATERMALRLEKRIADLRQTYESQQQDRITRRLAYLTVLSAVFLPLTFLAGIWGMNWENMPELSTDNGYYYALALMATIALCMLLFFWRTGWFE